MYPDPWGAPAPPRRLKFLGALLILADTAWFAHRGFTAYFSMDDMMNLGRYWSTPWWKLLGAQVVFFSSYYRPLGAFFYLPLFHLFGFNPLPYHVAMTAVVLANTWLVYRVGWHLSGSAWAAGLAAFVLAFHAGMAEIYYSPAVIYDVLCFFFYFLALERYLAVRTRGGLPTGRQVALIAVLYACALNAKEMAVTLPAVLLAYEICLHRPRPGEWRAWLWGSGRVAALSGVMSALYVAGKMLGPNPLREIDAYRPVYTWTRFLDSSRLHLNSHLMQGEIFSAAGVLLVWAAALGIALLRKQGDLRFCWCAVLAAPLPVVFIRRAHACLYIPLAFWAFYVAIALTEASRRLGQALARRYRCAFCTKLAPALAAVAFAGVVFSGNSRMRPYYEADIVKQGRATQAVIEQLDALRPAVKPHSRVLFVNDPFADWDMLFIARLWFRDPTLDIRLQGKTPVTDPSWGDMDYVFRFESGTLVQVKPRPWRAPRSAAL